MTPVSAILVLAAALAWEPDGVPYEITRAGRTRDDHPPAVAFEGAGGWTASGSNAVAVAGTSTEHRLFGTGSLKLTYRATGTNPVVRLRPTAPVALADDADTISIWCYGNNNYGRNHGKADTPVTTLYAEFADGKGGVASVELESVDHREWFLSVRPIPPDTLALVRRGGNRLTGFRLEGGTNVGERELFLTSFAAFRDVRGPLEFAPRAQRGVRIFSDQPQGLNVGRGRLPFPNSPRTILPPKCAADPRIEFRFPKRPEASWDDLAFRWRGGDWIPFGRGGGLWPLAARTNATVRFFRDGNSVVADIVAKGGVAEEVRFGTVEGLDKVVRIPIPYVSFRLRRMNRPCTLGFEIGGTPLFLSAYSDWTQSGASEPYSAPPRWGIAPLGGMRYVPKTDGRRNDVYERFVWTVSTDFAATLPSIPNPPSPWKRVTSAGVWTAFAAGGDRLADAAYWRGRRRLGLKHLIVTDHETMWRDGNESFTFRTETAPVKGGDAAQRNYTRTMIDELGYVYGPYNNFTDFAPVNAFWSPDRVSRRPDGRMQRAWCRCYAPKPAWAVGACAEISPVLQKKFCFNTAYCDVHTASPPWSRTDYDARVPGAGTFAQVFYCFGEIMLLQRQAWQGPVYSEGGVHALYCGLTDGNYAQDSEYEIAENEWLVDFDLLRLHPLCCNFGMGNPAMFYHDRPPSDRWKFIDRFLAATVAFGHTGFLVRERDLEIHSYAMVQAVAARYARADVREIRYGDGTGGWLDTSRAIVTGAYRNNRLRVTYSDGTLVGANGGRDDAGDLSFPTPQGRIALPPDGFVAIAGDGKACSVSARTGTNRADVAVSGEYVYLNGRGNFVRFAGGGTDGQLFRTVVSDTEEDVVVRAATRAVLPYVAESVVSTGRDLRERGPVDFRIVAGQTELVPSAADFVLRVRRKKGDFALSMAEALAPFVDRIKEAK